MTSTASSVAASRKHEEAVSQFIGGVSDADIRLLRVFCVVVACGGLSAATNELVADLSAVSRCIKDLEDKVGVRLCNRGRSGFSLTPHGAAVHTAAQELFCALNAFRENVNTLRADPVGELKLGVMDALLSDPQFRLPSALRRYRAKAPRVHINLTVCKPADIERQVMAAALDAGIVASAERLPGLDYLPLYQETSSLYCSAHHPLYHRCDQHIGAGEQPGLDLVVDPYTDSLPVLNSSAVFRRAAKADSLEAVALLVSSGDYVGFLPDHFASMLSGSVAYRPIRPDLFSYQQGIDLVWRSGPMNPFVQSLLAELRALGNTL
ncbi:LysR family transcriptional regulator [Pseudoduganella aquatica]|uniref:LysR family transcriptional regulator n=1 Tax=Pseudoduganella aquatica TaxID=2660641 RepID=UPI001E5C0C4E|nr:LysR family transcriptional regulator [Pseudoduganella aquatica]